MGGGTLLGVFRSLLDFKTYSFKLLSILECHKLLKTACQDHKNTWREDLQTKCQK